jgi:glycosyltransferase involved in cell wall biosynthesis
MPSDPLPQCPPPAEPAALPWLSVLMPTYNGARYVAEALRSVAAAGASDVEVIVVDDGSTDQTLAIVESFADRLALRIATPARTGNWVAGTNHAIGLARGSYLCSLHQDDYWLPGRLERLRAEVARHGDAALIVHPVRFIDAAGRDLGTWRCPLPEEQGRVDPALLVSRLLVQNFLSMPAPLFSRAAAAAVGGLDEDLWYTADWDLWLKLAGAGPCLYVPQVLACFRIHPASQTASRSADAVEFRRQLELVLRRHLPPFLASQARGGSRLARVAEFSVDVNTALAAAAHGQRPAWGPLAWRALKLGPRGWRQYWRDSRIGERVCSRMRLGGSQRTAAV